MLVRVIHVVVTETKSIFEYMIQHRVIKEFKIRINSECKQSAEFLCKVFCNLPVLIGMESIVFT